MAASFGYLIMANTGLSILTTASLGVLGALVAARLAQRNSSAEASIQSERHDSGGSSSSSPGISQA
ncbi:hypothetical protein MSAR_37630 [Mycolicibacterium sarraceniae]|uniref:Uncharacterized protein n=1 Tax=Mycolicibacterium sarraceniae TaxID=1534348 RepID=A0A7I7SUD5_9MYCO|nr:hypothetical protein MSAR_37630 [Mycolicibacterium sarraceniae]